MRLTHEGERFSFFGQQIRPNFVETSVVRIFRKHSFLGKKLFEIYFVRLIGTPNQKFRDTRFTSCVPVFGASHLLLVVHESLGFMTL